jgi:hypothetical protein
MKCKLAYPKILMFSAIALLLVSCQFKTLKGSGNVTTENRTVQGEFKSIDAEKGLDVVLEQAPVSSVTVIADDNLQKHIKTKVVNGVLKITSDYGGYINVKSKKIVVKMPVVENIQVSSGATFNARSTIKGNAITLKSSSGSSIEINLEAEKASCEASSGSDITINGKVIDLETAASSGSSIDAEKLLSNTIVASASSGSSIDVFPLVSLNAEASSGASINYHNVPKNLNKKSSSGGSIDKE